ncbi:MAG TPA: coenzyme F420-0:L-glutamate ligase [Acidimicrobiales bacterium]|nr:coenzyme F420-0:L-glutamate ligase [Acidimicrobiales bacterium]
MPAERTIEIIPVSGIGEVSRGDDLATLLVENAHLSELDVVVVTQKIVSKAEGRLVASNPLDPTARENLIQRESVRILRRRDELFVTETPHGFICANAGVDWSNVDDGWAAILPADPDRSARRIRDGIKAQTGHNVGVVISDTFGRPWRRGLTDVAIGCAGVAAIVDLRGTTDTKGRELFATEVCVADELAGAAELVMGKSRGVPAAIVRGADESWFRRSSVATEIVRPAGEDLFR